MAFLRRLLSRPLPLHERLLGETKASFLPLTTRVALLSWAERIRPHAPHCFTIYNNLMQHGRGHVSHATFYVLKDCPDSHIVVWKLTCSSASQNVGVFCLEKEAEQLTEVLAAAPFLDWNDSFAIHHIPPYLVSFLQQLTKEKGTNVSLESYDAFTYQPHMDKEPLRLGPGLRMCRSHSAGLHRFVKITKYDCDVPLEVMCGLARSVPYLGVYRDDGVTQSTIVDVSNLSVAGEEEVPVSWCISSLNGEVAKLETVPEYRRRGLGSTITTAMARLQAGLLGFIPHAFVDKDNFASRATMTQKGVFQYTHEVVALYTDSQE